MVGITAFNTCRFPDNPADQNAASGARPQNPCHLFSAAKPSLQPLGAARQALAAGKHRQDLAARQGGTAPSSRPRRRRAPAVVEPPPSSRGTKRSIGRPKNPWIAAACGLAMTQSWRHRAPAVITRNEAIHLLPHETLDCRGLRPRNDAVVASSGHTPSSHPRCHREERSDPSAAPRNPGLLRPAASQ